MATAALLHVLAAVAALVVAVAAGDSDPGKIGICHGRVGSNLPPPSAAAALLRQNGITKARLFLPDPAVLPAFAAAGLDLTVGVPNENLTFLSASGPDGAAQWLRSTVFAYAPADRVRYLAVGNEVLYNNQFYAPHLVPAMRNLHAALVSLGLDARVKVSSAHASSVLAASYPPSAGAFDAASLPVLRPMLRFLADTGRAIHGEHVPFHQPRERPGQRAARVRRVRGRRRARAGRGDGVHEPVRRHGGRGGGRAGEGRVRGRTRRGDRDRVAYRGSPGRHARERCGVQR
ncbi:hypothetical protein PR202_gb23126 [Eleusine coracana subsp. coracana]|uniref:Glucan endo-1,3-beta-D-glucosidase n=1 Tax=Eleusine coracana subsp. coracana TaxID=191504 RepID=A0AAV5FFI0_ELECO|nr:hypothetical protein PR202_gb23126 [Eleusine coracana subsp. coracana]